MKAEPPRDVCVAHAVLCRLSSIYRLFDLMSTRCKAKCLQILLLVMYGVCVSSSSLLLVVWSQVWDDELGYLLGPSLFAYEQERVDGASFGSGDFQDAVEGAVPDRWNIAISDRFLSVLSSHDLLFPNYRGAAIFGKVAVKSVILTY